MALAFQGSCPTIVWRSATEHPFATEEPAPASARTLIIHCSQIATVVVQAVGAQRPCAPTDSFS
jgi:hypothetical protein